MRSLLLTTTLLTVGAFIPSALGIGRTGNGALISASQGFQAEIPKGFESSKELSEERLQLLSGMPLFGPLGPAPLFLELANAGYSLPDLAQLSRADLNAKIIAQGWVPISSPNPCIDSYFKASNMALATFWGGGKGLVMVGPPSYPVEKAEKSLLASLQLLPEACAW